MHTFLAAVGIFLASYASRCVDSVLCRYISIGTHLLWHLLNARLLFPLVKTAIQFDLRRAELLGQPP